MTTTLQIHQKSRSVEFVDRDQFCLGESYDPLILANVLGADLSSLCIFFYSSTGTLLAGSFNIGGEGGTAEIIKVLDRYHASTVNFLSQGCIDLFASSTDDQPITMIVRDESLIYCKATVMLKYAPNIVAGPAPEGTALTAAFAAHNIDPDSHLGLVACSQIPDLTLNALDDNITFEQLLTNYNLLVVALRTSRGQPT